MQLGLAGGTLCLAAEPASRPPANWYARSFYLLHLSPEMVLDRRLEKGDVRGRLLILEDPAELTAANR